MTEEGASAVWMGRDLIGLVLRGEMELKALDFFSVLKVKGVAASIMHCVLMACILLFSDCLFSGTLKL